MVIALGTDWRAIVYIATPIFFMFGFDFEFLQFILGVQEMVMAGYR